MECCGSVLRNGICPYFYSRAIQLVLQGFEAIQNYVAHVMARY